MTKTACVTPTLLLFFLFLRTLKKYEYGLYKGKFNMLYCTTATACYPPENRKRPQKTAGEQNIKFNKF